MLIIYFLLVYLVFYMLTSYINKMANVDLYLINKLKINTRNKVAFYGAITSAILYTLLSLLSELSGWGIESYIFSAASIGITVALIVNVNKKLLAPKTKKSNKNKK